MSLLALFTLLLVVVPAIPASALQENFDGPALPADWFTAAWAPGGAVTVVDGRLTVDGARAGTTAVFPAGRSLEFVATFTGDPWQHIGFGDDYNSGRWVIFSTFFGGQLYARTNADSGELIDTPLPAVALGVPHRFRIDWGASTVVFSVDDVVVATHAATIANALRPLVSDYTTGSSLTVESIEMFTSVLRTDLSDPELPAGWFSAAWAAGGAATLSGGHLTVDGARAGTEALYGPGRSLEFVATFTGDHWQHIGFGIDYNDGPWITFSTYTGGQLYARTRSESGQLIDTPITGEWLGTPHRYRIDWNATHVVFSIDGVIVATHDTAIALEVRPLLSDYDAGSGALDVDELEMVVPDFALDFTSVPAGWSSGLWHAGGSARVAGGLLTVDGAWAGTAELYGPGRLLEFVATFTGDPWQHIGFGIDYYAAPQITFSTFQGGQLYARTRSESGEQIDTPIPGDWFNAPHQFRIEWGAGSIVFSIDGVVVATHDVAVAASARPLVSDFETGGGVLTVASLTMTAMPTPRTPIEELADALTRFVNDPPVPLSPGLQATLSNLITSLPSRFETLTPRQRFVLIAGVTVFKSVVTQSIARRTLPPAAGADLIELANLVIAALRA